MIPTHVQADYYLCKECDGKFEIPDAVEATFAYGSECSIAFCHSPAYTSYILFLVVKEKEG